MEQIQPLHSASNPYITESSFLIKAIETIFGSAVWKNILFQARDENNGELESLGTV